ncbi:MAG: glycosyltransferase [Bacteroidaceae bacterium]|nr:glycosyltransferase [Bacteroidaceae bacterium]
MKVLYILHSTIMGGATISFLNMIEGLRTKGVEVAVILPKRDVAFEKNLEELGSDYYYCPLIKSIWGNKNKNQLYKKFLLYPLKFIKKEYIKFQSFKNLCKIVKKISPDIIHTNTGVIHEGYKCANKYSIPHVWHLREYQDKDFHWEIYPSKKIFEKYLNNSYVVTITEDILHHFHLCQNHHAQTIYNGVLSNVLIYNDWPKQRYFLCASRIGPEKGHEDTIKAFAEFHKKVPDVRLCILGFGNNDYIENLQKMAKKLNCDDAIDWMGFQSDVVKYMRHAVALIVSSRYEGFGRMTAEACFCGCVVVGRETGGTKEILDQAGGLFFNDVDTLQKKMEEIVSWDEKQYMSVALKAQKVAMELYSIESNVDQIYNLYKRILKEKS